IGGERMKLVLFVISAVLLGVLYWQWRDWAPDLPAPMQNTIADGQPTESQRPLDASPLAPQPPKEDYASVAERPLFIADRRPPPDEPEQEDEPEPEVLTELDGMDLTAVVITPTTVSAWIRRPNEREVQRLRLGDDFEGWMVKTIEPDRVVLERQGETDQLVLRDYTKASAMAPPPRMPAARRQPTGRQQQTPATPPTAEGQDPGAAPPARRQRAARPAAR
ncbi:MAG: type II secretion system protein N, partial [Thiohalocapsa sp.]